MSDAILIVDRRRDKPWRDAGNKEAKAGTAGDLKLRAGCRMVIHLRALKLNTEDSEASRKERDRSCFIQPHLLYRQDV